MANDKKLNLILQVSDKFSSALNSFNKSIDKSTKNMENTSKQADKMNDAINKAGSTAGGSGAKGIGGFIKSIKGIGDVAEVAVAKIMLIVGAITAVIGAAKKMGELINEGFDLASIQNASERQLATVMKNMGGSKNDYQGILTKASELQSKTAYGDEAYIAGAGELSTYISDPKAIQSMMGTLSNYAAGMSGGTGEINSEQMVEYATQLGKALNGTYDGLAKKGFTLTDAQKKIIENGSDMEKALVLDEIINESWDSLAESMASLPENKIQSFNNKIGDIKEQIGNNATPAIENFYSMISEHIPTLETLATWMSNLGAGFINFASGFIDVVMGIVDEFTQVASTIGTALAPIMSIVVGVFSMAFAEVYNIFIYPLQFALAELVNFLGNVFNDPVAAIEVLFYDMGISILEGINNVVKAAINLINQIPGVEVGVDNGVTNWVSDKIEKLSKQRADVMAESGYKRYVDLPTRKDLTDAFNAGKDFVDNFGKNFKPDNWENALGGGSGEPVEVTGTGSGGSLKVNMADEDIAYLRDLAQREYVAKIAQNTLAPNINVSFGDVHENADINVIERGIREILSGEIERASAGVY